MDVFMLLQRGCHSLVYLYPLLNFYRDQKESYFNCKQGDSSCPTYLFTFVFHVLLYLRPIYHWVLFLDALVLALLPIHKIMQKRKCFISPSGGACAMFSILKSSIAQLGWSTKISFSFTLLLKHQFLTLLLKTCFEMTIPIFLLYFLTKWLY